MAAEVARHRNRHVVVWVATIRPALELPDQPHHQVSSIQLSATGAFVSRRGREIATARLIRVPFRGTRRNARPADRVGGRGACSAKSMSDTSSCLTPGGSVHRQHAGWLWRAASPYLSARARRTRAMTFLDGGILPAPIASRSSAPCPRAALASSESSGCPRFLCRRIKLYS